MKKILSVLLLLVIQMGFHKTICHGKGYFSFNEIKDISVLVLLLSAKNALFSKNTLDNQINDTTVDGLSGQTISSIYYSLHLKKRWLVTKRLTNCN
jgi:hypothetical protein